MNFIILKHLHTKQRITETIPRKLKPPPSKQTLLKKNSRI